MVRCIHPEFIGFHLLNESELSNKACLKAYAEEKVGVFVERGGCTEILEYSDLPEELSQARDENGDLSYRAGSIAIHIFDRELISRVGSGEDASIKLPFHRANKKIPFVDAHGELQHPDEPNGVKFEMFGFDALPFAKNPMVIETARADEFSPVKNAEGVDSPKTSREDQLRQYARWAIAAGLDLLVDDTGLPDFEFEVSPLFADNAEQFAARVAAGSVELGEGVVLK
ncbi:MAG: hypothetical protein AAF226_15765 [Verrucomicrobiota bacterium]